MVSSKLLPEDEKNIKRLLALEVFGEKAIKRAESTSKKIYEIIVNGKKVKEELINIGGALMNKDGKMVFIVKPEFLA